MKRNAAKRKLSKPAAKVLQCLELMVYAYSVLYGFLPEGMGGGNPDAASLQVLPGTAIGIHLAVKVWRMFMPAMARLKPRTVLKNLPRFARNTLCAILFYMPMLFSVAATSDSGMDLPIMAGVILMISACWTFIVFLCDLFLLMIHKAPRGKRRGKPVRRLGYDIRLRDFLDRSWLPLYVVTGGLYAAFLFAEISATLSGVEPMGFQIVVSIAIYIAFSALIYRILFRLACRVYALNKILGALMHVLRMFLCGMVILAAVLASDKRIGDLRHNVDYLARNMQGGFFIGAMMECFALLFRRKYGTEQPADRQAPPEKTRASDGEDWFDHLQAQGKALEREAQAHSAASARSAVTGASAASRPDPRSAELPGKAAAANGSAQEGPKDAPVIALPVVKISSDGAPGTVARGISEVVRTESGPEVQSWAAADRWWIDEDPAPEQETRDRSETGESMSGGARGTVPPEEVSRSRLLKWLTLMEKTLQPQGEALGTLSGQRALFEEAEAILPVLSTLRALPPLARFLFEDATEEADLPERVGTLLSGIIDAIRQADLEVMNIYWLDLSPETLIRGWRALSAYRRISTGQAVFGEVLELLESHMLEREDVVNWLCWQCRGVDA